MPSGLVRSPTRRGTSSSSGRRCGAGRWGRALEAASRPGLAVSGWPGWFRYRGVGVQVPAHGRHLRESPRLVANRRYRDVGQRRHRHPRPGAAFPHRRHRRAGCSASSRTSTRGRRRPAGASFTREEPGSYQASGTGSVALRKDGRLRVQDQGPRREHLRRGEGAGTRPSRYRPPFRRSMPQGGACAPGNPRDEARQGCRPGRGMTNVLMSR
jgi:hypothetical protein